MYSAKLDLESRSVTRQRVLEPDSRVESGRAGHHVVGSKPDSSSNRNSIESPYRKPPSAKTASALFFEWNRSRRQKTIWFCGTSVIERAL